MHAMALAGRSPRRDGGRRLLVAGIILTLFVVIIDASLKSRSPGVAPRLSAAAWVDRVLPIIQASSTEGRMIANIRSSGSGMAPSSITSQLNQVAAGARRTYQAAAALNPPAQLSAAGGLLDACLLVRSQAAGEMAQAVGRELASGSGLPSTTAPTIAIGSAPPTPSSSLTADAGSGTDPQIKALGAAGRDFEIADRAYRLFAQRLPSVGVKAPTSTWVDDPSQYSSSNLEVFAADLRSAGTGSGPGSSSDHQITIPMVTLNPGPLNVQGGVEILVATKAVSISAVVSNNGTQTEGTLAVIATINPSAGNAVFKQIISLPPGAAYNTPLGPLNPKPGAVTTLTIAVISASGTSLATSTVTFTTG